MPFEFKKTEIEGLMLIKPHMYPDERGLYKKYYEKNIFAEEVLPVPLGPQSKYACAILFSSIALLKACTIFS